MKTYVSKIIICSLVSAGLGSPGYAVEQKSEKKPSSQGKKQSLVRERKKISAVGSTSCVAKVTCYDCGSNISGWDASYIALFDSGGNSLGGESGYGLCPSSQQQVPNYVSGLCNSFSYELLASSLNTLCPGM